MKAIMRRLKRLEVKNRDRRVVLRFHLDDGRVVDSAMNEIKETDHHGNARCVFIDFSEADLYL